MKKFISFFFLLGGLSLPLFAADSPQDLDAAILKERLKKIYGDFVVKTAGEWQVSYQGKVNIWKWGSKGWTCPADSGIKCSEWVPQGFHWWSAKGFLDNWSPVARTGFEFGKSKTRAAVPAPMGIVSNVVELAPSPTPATEVVEEQDVFGGKKWALDVWDWKSQQGASAKVYISLRDQKIERIDVDDSIEYFDWKERTSGGQNLARVVLEKNGLRVVFSKLK